MTKNELLKILQNKILESDFDLFRCVHSAPKERFADRIREFRKSSIWDSNVFKYELKNRFYLKITKFDMLKLTAKEIALYNEEDELIIEFSGDDISMILSWIKIRHDKSIREDELRLKKEKEKEEDNKEKLLKNKLKNW